MPDLWNAFDIWWMHRCIYTRLTVLQTMAFKILLIVWYWFSLWFHASTYRSHTLKPIYSLSDTHTRERTCRKRWLCISHGTCWQCSDALFPFYSEKESCSHWGINASSLDPLSQICWKQEKDVLYKTATHSSEWPAAVEPVPRGKWRCVYLRVRRNEVRMPRTRHATAV